MKINPNDEPFLPIYPTYPYNPKLIKRDAGRELVPQLTSEPYEAPKEDVKDSYSTSYSNNYQRDAYYPNYNPYPKNTSPSPTYSPYYNEDPYTYTGPPYATYNPYPTPYAVSPAAYPASSYPDYYYQPAYYYPHYFNHALFPPPPPPPSLASPQPSSEGVDYHETSQDSVEAEDDKRNKDKKGKKSKENETNQEAGQFVDGGNYISGNTRDLDGQSSTYKVASPYNQLEQDVQTKSPPIPLPKTTYRVISVGGQPVGPDYPLPAQYVKAQQIEQLMSQTLATLLAQNAQQQAGQSYESNRDNLSGASDGSYANQDNYNLNTQSYVAVPGVRTKTGVAYVINSDGIGKVNGEQANPQVPPSHTLSTSSKNVKYPNNLYVRKPATQAILDQSQTTLNLPQVTYVPQQSSRSKKPHRDRVVNSRPADPAAEYDSYDASQSYMSTLSQTGSKQEQNYGNYQRQAGSYRNKDFVAASQTPRTIYSYQYSAYETDQATTVQPRQNVNLDDGNFGAKQ